MAFASLATDKVEDLLDVARCRGEARRSFRSALGSGRKCWPLRRKFADASARLLAGRFYSPAGCQAFFVWNFPLKRRKHFGNKLARTFSDLLLTYVKTHSRLPFS
jgi:hypothetical protein